MNANGNNFRRVIFPNLAHSRNKPRGGGLGAWQI
jgi:hypothetical protein